MPRSAPAELTPASFPEAVAALCRHDAMLAGMVDRWGVPPFWVHPRGFAGLTLAILAQLVSLESAHATWRKLHRALPQVTPAAFLALDDARLRQLGCSRAKIGYLKQIARDIVEGALDLEQLQLLDDSAVRERLQQLRGAGRWTADTWLLFSLCRADAWPSGDLALERTLADPDTRQPALPAAEADLMADAWRPWRSVAARILWCHYLHVRGRFDAVGVSWAEVSAEPETHAACW